MKQTVTIREALNWPWGYVAIRTNTKGVVAWTLQGSDLSNVRAKAQEVAAIYEATLIDQTGAA